MLVAINSGSFIVTLAIVTYLLILYFVLVAAMLIVVVIVAISVVRLAVLVATLSLELLLRLSLAPFVCPERWLEC